MSIRGIDTQIMISRLTDNVRDTSAMQKRPEVIQDSLAAQGRINDAQDSTRVAKTLETEMEQIRPNVDDGGGAAYGGGEGDGTGKKKKEEQDKDLLVPPVNHIIDIVV